MTTWTADNAATTPRVYARVLADGRQRIVQDGRVRVWRDGAPIWIDERTNVPVTSVTFFPELP